MSDSPANLSISDITSRSMTVAWKRPIESHGDILGYVLQFRDESDTCHKEIVIQCSDCNDTMVSFSFPKIYYFIASYQRILEFWIFKIKLRLNGYFRINNTPTVHS